MKNDIHEHALKCAREFRTASVNLFAILLEVDERKAFEDHNYTFLTPYCVGYLEIDPDIAKTLVRIVKKSIHVPELASAVVNGEIHISNAKVICSVITPGNHAEWITKAKKLTKKDLEKEVSQNGGHDKKKLTLDLPIETVEKLNRARDLASTKAAEFLSFEKTIDHALDLYLYKHDPVKKAQRSTECPQDPSSATAVKHQRNLRDLGRCVVIYADGTQCEEEKWLDAHHVIHRADGGDDSIENLVTMCKAHHRLLHKHH